MRVEYHPAVARDIADALRRYDAVSECLAHEFEKELRRVIAVARENPARFHLLKPAVHRANLQRFPYHVVYRDLPDGIRVVLVRHHRRDLTYGMERD